MALDITQGLTLIANAIDNLSKRVSVLEAAEAQEKTDEQSISDQLDTILNSSPSLNPPAPPST
jgi:hypothetical protein